MTEKNKEPEMKNIYQALAAAQAGMAPVVKGSVNPHYKSKYADLADVMSVVIPALSAQGISVWHSMPKVDGDLFMRTNLSHGLTDTHIYCDVPLIVAQNNMQGMKSATTYAKRIGIESLTGVAPDDDDGNEASKNPPTKKAAPAPEKPKGPSDSDINAAITALSEATSLDGLKAVWVGIPEGLRAERRVLNAKDARKAEIDISDASSDSAADDEIKY